MIDGTIENLPALLGLVTCLVASTLLIWRARRERAARSWSRLETLGAASLGLYWLVLLPLNAFSVVSGDPLGPVFGTETTDGGIVEYLTTAQWLLSSVLCFLLFRARFCGLTWLWLVGAVGAFVAAGEELSWGQWLFHWGTPEAWRGVNLQNETNLHNLASPDQFDAAYRILGLLIVLTYILLLHVVRKGPLEIADRGREWLATSFTAAPMALTAAVFLQHPAMQEMAEAALTSALVLGLLYMNGLAWQPRAARRRLTG